MSLSPYEFRSPAALMDDIAAAVSLVEGSAHLVLVSDPSTVQRIVSIERLDAPARFGNWDQTRDELFHRIQAWSLPRVVPPNHAALVVLVRTGFCVIGANEGAWANVWRWVNHWQPLYSGGVIVVTEHGWMDWDTELAGSTPALEPTA